MRLRLLGLWICSTKINGWRRNLSKWRFILTFCMVDCFLSHPSPQMMGIMHWCVDVKWRNMPAFGTRRAIACFRNHDSAADVVAIRDRRTWWRQFAHRFDDAFLSWYEVVRYGSFWHEASNACFRKRVFTIAADVRGGNSTGSYVVAPIRSPFR